MGARARAWVVSAAAAALAGGGPRLARADTITITSAADTTLYSESASLSNGAGDHMFAGQTGGSSLRRALLRFDISGSVPADSTITAVTLTLNLSRTNVGARDVALHVVTSTWGEASSDAGGNEGGGAAAQPGDATWSHGLYDTLPWSAAGGDFIASASATASVGGTLTTYSWSSPQMTIDVKSWLDAPSTNHGWLVDLPGAAAGDTKRFDTRESGSTTAPTLEITFEPPPATGACCPASGECTITEGASACSGTYQGDGSVCDPNPCPQPDGACCLPDASATCLLRTELECQAEGGDYRGDFSPCTAADCPVVLTPFIDPLPIPDVAAPTSGSAGGAASYRISAVELEQTLHSELPPTTVWGYDDGTGGSFPGPTIEARTGEPVTVVWANDLRDADGALRDSHVLPVDTCIHGASDQSPRTVQHLHGGHVAAEFDGYPEDTILPGEEQVYEYPNWQKASAIWYHDHALGITRLNVYMGLAGLYVIRDAAEAALGLPAGSYEVPLVIQDRQLGPDGQLIYPESWQEHFFGDHILVNGMVWPYLEVDRGKYRFRVLNGSNARTFRLSLSTGDDFQLIGTDGGLLDAPVEVNEILLTPAERADLIIDFSGHAPGTEILLENSAPAPFPGNPGTGVVPQVMKLVVGGESGHSEEIPSSLVPMSPLPEDEAVMSRQFVLEKADDPCTGSMWTINGLRWDDITERPTLGTSEVWTFVNPSGFTHPMHMHLVFFQVLRRRSFEMQDGIPVATGSLPIRPHERGWKDTVAVGPNEMVSVIARFEDFVGKFAYHCHILEHEDHEMMRQFETRTTCGDGARGLPVEECDDGNTDDGDGCSSICLDEIAGPDAGPPGGGVVTEGMDGGCGCQSGRAPGSATLALIGLVLAALRRRARRG